MKFRLKTYTGVYDSHKAAEHIKNLESLGFEFFSCDDDYHHLYEDPPVFIELNSIDELETLYGKIKCPLIIDADKDEKSIEIYDFVLI